MSGREKRGGLAPLVCLFLWLRRNRHTQLKSVLLDMLMSQMGEERRVEWMRRGGLSGTCPGLGVLRGSSLSSSDVSHRVVKQK